MTNQEFKIFKEEMQAHVSLTIEKVVNGKINDLSTKINNYIIADTAWKVRAEPVIKAFENTNWLWRLFVSVLKFTALLGAAGGAYIAVTSVFKQ